MDEKTEGAVRLFPVFVINLEISWFRRIPGEMDVIVRIGRYGRYIGAGLNTPCQTFIAGPGIPPVGALFITNISSGWTKIFIPA